MKTTYCNPLDLGYRYQHMKEGPRTAGFREGADPTLVYFKGKYYLFVSSGLELPRRPQPADL